MPKSRLFLLVSIVAISIHTLGNFQAIKFHEKRAAAEEEISQPSVIIATGHEKTAAAVKSPSEEEISQPSVIIAGVAMNIEPSVIRSLVPKFTNLGQSLGRPYHIYIYENNSPPESRTAWIEELSKDANSTFLFEDIRLQHSRPQRIANARNIVLEGVRKKWPEAEFLIMADLDGVCGEMGSPDGYNATLVKKMMSEQSRGSWDAVSFMFPPYWDRWAFRQRDVMPYNMYGRHGRKNKIQSMDGMDNWVTSQPREHFIEVESAFMMFAMYRLSATTGCEYSGIDEYEDADCEHVAFHKDMREKNGAKIRIYTSFYCDQVNEDSRVPSI